MSRMNGHTMALIAGASLAALGMNGVHDNRPIAIQPPRRPSWIQSIKRKKTGRGKFNRKPFEMLSPAMQDYVLIKKEKYRLRDERRQANYEKGLRNGIFKGHFGKPMSEGIAAQ